jgi:hypothetical protein
MEKEKNSSTWNTTDEKVFIKGLSKERLEKYLNYMKGDGDFSRKVFNHTIKDGDRVVSCNIKRDECIEYAEGIFNA